ncbi:ribonuclease H2, subunit C [Fomitopsis serialis]|uniref:ribonuclease H2, subunit C n=1 Tax=Fomitopsis serialis TaxID=139415 RepID=UPI0020078B9D|nr:ribonuclease H2, subunit C [Neoantrodia serialis]KAH9926993.1 ribonuclease H2, subunit C [Neoantrodia serialis]
MSSSIAIARVDEPLPTCTPYLMPFHIDYSGPAPISTYFRVKPAPPPGYLGKPENANEATQNASESQTSSTSQTTLVASSSDATLDSRIGESSQDTLVDDASPSQTKMQPAGDRYVAAFRGRTVQGLKVELPEGYAGLVLQTPEGVSTARPGKRSGASAKERGQPQATRSTRRSSQKEVMDIDTDVGALSTFSSFVLWNQDIPVDEGKDEYLRSIREWTRLAAEVHRVEDI